MVDAALTADVERTVDAVLRGGIRLVQYRSKSGIDRSLVRRLHRNTKQRGALLIVNDDVEAAVDADGVHLGQEDLALVGRGVRERLKGRILGISCGVPAEASDAVRLGADYLGVGPFAASASKADAGPPIGADGVAAVVAAAMDVPVAAVGGIDLSNVREVAKTGAKMAAVLSALVREGDPEESARALTRAWQSAIG